MNGKPAVSYKVSDVLRVIADRNDKGFKPTRAVVIAELHKIDNSKVCSPKMMSMLLKVLVSGGMLTFDKGYVATLYGRVAYLVKETKSPE